MNLNFITYDYPPIVGDIIKLVSGENFPTLTTSVGNGFLVSSVEHMPDDWNGRGTRGYLVKIEDFQGKGMHLWFQQGADTRAWILVLRLDDD